MLITGEVVRLGGKHLDAGGYDLLGVVIGSEGLLGVVTEVTVRILRKPEAARALLIGFPTSEEAGACVGRIIAAGIIPAGIEMMDRLAIHAVEEFVHAGYPLDVEAILIVELDGPRSRGRSPGRARRRNRARAAAPPRCALRPRRRSALLFWAGRKAAFPAMGRISPDYFCMDGTIPRAMLPHVLQSHARNVAAPTACGSPMCSMPATAICIRSSSTTPTQPGELERAEAFGADILKLCVEVGGVLTGEHGVGVEKRDLMPVMFSRDRSRPAAAAQMRLRRQGPAQSRQGVSDAASLRRARPHACERRRSLPFPDIPRF